MRLNPQSWMAWFFDQDSQFAQQNFCRALYYKFIEEFPLNIFCTHFAKALRATAETSSVFLYLVALLKCVFLSSW